jgi:hypothetical protein
LLLHVLRQAVLTVMEIRDAWRTGDRSILEGESHRPLVGAVVRLLDRLRPL